MASFVWSESGSGVKWYRQVNNSLLYMYDFNMSNLFVKPVENHLPVSLMNQFHLKVCTGGSPSEGRERSKSQRDCERSFEQLWVQYLAKGGLQHQGKVTQVTTVKICRFFFTFLPFSLEQLVNFNRTWPKKSFGKRLSGCSNEWLGSLPRERRWLREQWK